MINKTSLRCRLPCRQAAPNEHQTTCSLITRCSAVAVGSIFLLTGILALCDIPSLSSLGVMGGTLLLASGFLMSGSGLCINSVGAQSKSSTKSPQQQKTSKPFSNQSESYALDEVIERIHADREIGSRIAIFIGRTNDQQMPQEEGWEWFSLDKDIAATPTHHHLQIDFNCAEDMKKLVGCADKIVVDWSVLKFVHAFPWVMFKRLLCKEPWAQLIAEDYVGGYTTSQALTEVYLAPHDARITISESHLRTKQVKELENFTRWQQENKDTYQREYEAFLEKATVSARQEDIRYRFQHHILKKYHLQVEEPNYEEQLLEKIEAYLQSLFHHVELKEAPYPYRNETTVRKFWVATHPK